MSLLASQNLPEGGSQVSLTSLTSADAVFPQSVVIEPLPVRRPSVALIDSHAFCAQDGWIISEKTRESIVLSFKQEKRLSYTMPGIMSHDLFGDPVQNIGQKQFGETFHVQRNSEIIKEDSLVGMENLVKDGNLYSALDMTSRMLTKLGHGFGRAHQPSSLITQHSLILWTRRLQLLIAIRNYRLASLEMETFGDLEAPDLFWAYHLQSFDKQGTLVPFTLRLLAAEMPRHVNNAPEALTRCTKLVAKVKIILSNVTNGVSIDGGTEFDAGQSEKCVDLWKGRLMQSNYCLARTLFQMNEFTLGCTVFDEMASSGEKETPVLYSQAGRICLQLGDFSSAAEYFSKFNTRCDQTNPSMKALACMHRGFLSIFYGNYAEAAQAFAKAMQFDPENTHAINNYAACLLYQGKLSEAETALSAVVGPNLTECTCLNLSTLYELSSARCNPAKQNLLTNIVKSHGDAFHVSCLKL